MRSKAHYAMQIMVNVTVKNTLMVNDVTNVSLVHMECQEVMIWGVKLAIVILGDQLTENVTILMVRVFLGSNSEIWHHFKNLYNCPLVKAFLAVSFRNKTSA